MRRAVPSLNGEGTKGRSGHIEGDDVGAVACPYRHDVRGGGELSGVDLVNQTRPVRRDAPVAIGAGVSPVHTRHVTRPPFLVASLYPARCAVDSQPSWSMRAFRFATGEGPIIVLPESGSRPRSSRGVLEGPSVAGSPMPTRPLALAREAPPGWHQRGSRAGNKPNGFGVSVRRSLQRENENLDPLNNMDADGVLAWIGNHCQAYPL